MTETQTMTLADFLLARIAEDEKWAQQEFMAVDARLGVPREHWRRIPTQYSKQILAECEAKRRIAELHAPRPTADDRTKFGCGICDYDTDCSWQHESDSPGGCETIRALAAPYADHPDFREDWR